MPVRTEEQTWMAFPVDQQEIVIAPSSTEQRTGQKELWLVVAALTVLYLLVIAIGNRRYVWFDELLTFDIARSASLPQLWDRLVRFDCNPPATYVLSRISMAMVGPTPLGLRLPSMIEFYLGSMAVLVYVRRKAGTAFAAAAMLMVWAVGPTLYYAVEARPYALLFLSFACLLLSWDTAVKANRPLWTLAAVSLSTLGLASAHVFAPFTLFAFILAELIRFRRLRKPDYPLWAALLLPMLATLIYIPLIRLYGGVVFSFPANFNTLLLFFTDTFGPSVMAFVLLAVLLVPSHKPAQTAKAQFLPEETALFAWMFFVPVLLNFMLMHRHGMFYNRYCLPSQAAILVVLTIFLAHRLGFHRMAGYAAAAVLILAILKYQVWHPLRYPSPQRTGVLSSISPELPIVIGDGRAFFEMNHREAPGLLQRFYFLKDREAALHYAHTNYFQDFEAPGEMQKADFPLNANVEPYSSFVLGHHQFLLLDDPGGYVYSKLSASGASLVLLGDFSDAMPYVVEKLYAVTLPTR
jgi:hypothetical protein